MKCPHCNAAEAKPITHTFTMIYEDGSKMKFFMPSYHCGNNQCLRLYGPVNDQSFFSGAFNEVLNEFNNKMFKRSHYGL